MKAFFEEKIESLSSISFHFIKTHIENHVFYLTLARPEKRNAFTPTMVREIAYALQYANQEDDIWCVVINAEGPVFCAGMDLKVFQNPALDTPNFQIPEVGEIALGDAIGQLNKPSLAIIEGNVYAGGFLIICECMFVISSQTNTYTLTEVKRGIFPMQVMASLLKVMTKRKALEMCVLGKSYSAQEAFQLGIITHLATEHVSTKQMASDITNTILENAPFAIRKGIEISKQIENIEHSELHKSLKQQLEEIRISEDAQEGLLAFAEKRNPIWKNR